MKLSTFLILLIVVSIGVLIVKSNPSQNLLPFLSREGAPAQTPPATEAGRRYFLSGHVSQHFGDGHIIVSGTLSEDANGGRGTGGEYALVGRSDSSFLPDGTPIDCEVSPSGNYEFTNRSGVRQTVGVCAAIYSAPGTGRAGAWMSEGNPLDRPAYNRR